MPQAVSEFLRQVKQQDKAIAKLALKPMELVVLADIRKFLQVPHVIQEIVSAEKTPTLSLVVPMYEQLIEMLRDLQIKLPKLAHAIQASISKLEEYMEKTRSTPMHIFAMGRLYIYLTFAAKTQLFSLLNFIVLNPTIKFQWLREHWGETAYEHARMLVRNAVSLLIQ